MSVFFASTEEEREEIFELRYKVYIQELDKTHISHDNKRRIIKDDFDDDCFHLFTKVDNKITASLRTVVLNRHFSKTISSSYHIPESFIDEAGLHNISISDRFIVEKEYRASRVGFELMMEVYQFGLKKKNVPFCFINTEKSLLRNYLKFGFRIHSSFVTSTNEKRYCLLLLLKDFDYLKEIRSPFIRCFDETDSDNGYSASIAKKHFRFLAEDEVS